MDADRDIQQQLEQAIGHGPALPAPADRLAAGRAALLRRRLTVGGAAAVVAALMVTPFAIAAGGGGTRTVEPAPAAPAPASTRSAEASEEPATAEEPSQEPEQRWHRWEFVRFDGDGQLELRPGIEVLDRVDGYLRGTRWDHSVAMEVTWQGQVYWSSAEWDREEDSGSSGSTPENDGWADFRAWVASQAAANTGADDPGTGRPEMVVDNGDGTLTASPGTTILEQQADPDLPENFASASERTAAAYVEHKGVRYLALARPGQVIVVPSEGHGDSLAALLSWARAKYESGEGLL